MKKLKPFIAGSLVAVTLFSAPYASFAKDNKQDNSYKSSNSVKVEARFGNSFFHRFFNIFGNRANAATYTNTSVSMRSLAPSITGITAPTMLKTGETGTWTIKASDPKNTSLSYFVDWGDMTPSPQAKSQNQTFVQTSTFTHSYANPGTYKITFTVMNSASFKTTSTTTVKVVKSKTNNTPEIRSVTGSTNVKVDEEFTMTVNAYDPKNRALSYGVDWGDNPSMLKSTLGAKIAVQSTTFSHTYSQAGTYVATFTVENKKGKKASYSVKIVATDNSTDTTAPKIYNLRMQTGANTSTILWTTDEPATSKVFYSKTTPIDLGSSSTLSVSSNSLVTEHSLTISGLMPNSIYGFIIKSADSKGNEESFGEARFMTSTM